MSTGRTKGGAQVDAKQLHEDRKAFRADIFSMGADAGGSFLASRLDSLDFSTSVSNKP